MTDDRKIIELLREAAPDAPPSELREKVLTNARDARRRSRRGWFVATGIAAAWLAIVVTGLALERHETLETAALIDGGRESDDALARDVEDVPGAAELVQRMRLMADSTPPASWAAWRNRYRGLFDDSNGG